MNRIRCPWLPTLIVALAISALVAAAGCGPSGEESGTGNPPPATPAENGKFVRLVPGTGCEPENCDLKRSGGRDHVRWHNTSDTERKITFTAGWPFMEDEAVIVMAPGKWSAWFTLNETASGDYPYSVDPPLPGPGDPPDGPVISAGG